MDPQPSRKDFLCKLSSLNHVAVELCFICFALCAITISVGIGGVLFASSPKNLRRLESAKTFVRFSVMVGAER